jgi:hypothetical protein
VSLSGVIEAALGLAFVYFIFSSICSGFNEAIAQFLNKRANFLEAAIWQLLDDRPALGPAPAMPQGATPAPPSSPGSVVGQFWSHGLIQQLASPLADGRIRSLGRRFQQWHTNASRQPTLALIRQARTLALTSDSADLAMAVQRQQVAASMRAANTAKAGVPAADAAKAGAPAADGGKPGVASAAEATKRPILPPLMKRPSYIDAKSFATVLMGILIPDKTHTGIFADVRDGVNALPDSKLKRCLLDLVVAANADVANFRASLESWYNAEMDRVTGWYKRETKKILVALSLVVVLAVNIDTIGVARRLWSSPQTRTVVAAAARAQISAGATTATPSTPPASGAAPPAIVCPNKTTAA